MTRSGAPHENAGAGPATRACPPGRRRDQRSYLERARLTEKADARRHVRVVHVCQRIRSRGSASTLHIGRSMWCLDALIGVIRSSRGGPCVTAVG
ncbi:MAG: hypothetical protein KIT18_03700 [Burkholderiales bacterium]|nr:hypothetical protein [Burkholderiales bacterium]